MSLQSEVDARVMELYKGATVADLERGIANAERMANQIDGTLRSNRKQREQAVALRKHATMLRQELQKRKEVVE